MKVNKGDRSRSPRPKNSSRARSPICPRRVGGRALTVRAPRFTALPSVGQIVRRGQSLYEISGQPSCCLYGSVAPTRAFIAGMSQGSDVAELNANLDALGYGRDSRAYVSIAQTTAAIRALQSAHGVTVTGELLLGSVVFEPGRCASRA